MNYDAKVFIPDLIKDYKKILSETKKKFSDIQGYLDASIDCLNQLYKTEPSSEFEKLKLSSGNKLLQPLIQIPVSKHIKVYQLTLLLLKKLIEYNYLQKKNCFDITNILKSIFDQSQEENQLKIIEITLTMLNSSIINIENSQCITNILLISLKAFSFKTIDFKNPIRLLLKLLTSTIFSQKEIKDNSTIMLCLITYIEIIEGKRKDILPYNNITRCLSLELLTTALNALSYDLYSNKELNIIIKENMLKQLEKVFTSSLSNDILIGIKIVRITVLILNKFHIGFELIDSMLKFAGSNGWMRQIGLEGMSEIISNSEIMWVMYKEHKELYQRVIEAINKISNEFYSNLAKEQKDKEENKISSKKKVIDKDDIFIDNDDNGVTTVGMNTKIINKLIIEIFDNIKNSYIALMRKSEILTNQLNFNLSPEQNEKREMIEYKSDLIKDSLIFIIKTSTDDSIVQNYLSMFQNIVGIYASIYLPKVRDEFLSNLCDLVITTEDKSTTNSPQNNTSIKISFKNKKFLICQTLLNLSHCINVLEVSSWVILISSLHNIKEQLIQKGICNRKVEKYDIESLLAETNDFIMQFSKDAPVNNNKKEEENEPKSEHEENLIRLSLSIDNLFIDSNIFDKETLCNVIFALSSVITTSLETNPEIDIHFCILKLFQVAAINVNRIELFHTELIKLLSTIFEKKIDVISLFSLDVLCAATISIISKYKIKEVSLPDYNPNWGKESYQRTTLNPLNQIASQTLEPSTVLRFLDNLSKVIQHTGKYLDTFGWSSFIEICSIMINNNSEKTFDLVKLILNDYNVFLTPYNIIPILSLLGTFALYENDSNICFSAIELFWSCANLTENFQKKKIELTQYQKEVLEECNSTDKSKEIFFNEIWKHIFFKLTNINLDERSEVKKSGINVFTDIFISKIDNISFENRIFIINEIFIKMFRTNSNKYIECVKNKKEKAEEKKWEETATWTLLAIAKVIKAFINNSPYEQVNQCDIYQSYMTICKEMISTSSPQVIIQILKSINEVKIDTTHNMLIEKIDLYWKLIDEVKIYLSSEFFVTKYVSMNDALKLLFAIIDNFKKNFNDSRYMEQYENLLNKDNTNIILSMITVILSTVELNDPRHATVSPHKLIKIENEIFDFFDGCSRISKKEESLIMIYNYLFDYMKIDYTKPHSDTLCKRSLQSLYVIYSNRAFPYEKFIIELIESVKKILLYRSQNEYVEIVIKNSKSKSPLLFNEISSQLISIIKIYIENLSKEDIWNRIINIYESVFKQTELGYKSIQRQYQDELMKASMEMEIDIINFIINTLIPNSLFLSHELQSRLLKLFDMGCNLDYSSFTNNSTAISKICITNLFTLCRYKPKEEIVKESEALHLANSNQIEEFVTIKIKIAKMSTPILIRRCRDMMRKFLDDEIKSGAMPLSRTRLEELKFVLDNIRTLDVYPDFLELSKKKENNELCVMDVVAQSKKAHLFFLHPILAEFITTKETDIKMIIRDIFKLISTQMGIKDIDLYS